jgi:hypothetical protein
MIVFIIEDLWIHASVRFAPLASLRVSGLFFFFFNGLIMPLAALHAVNENLPHKEGRAYAVLAALVIMQFLLCSLRSDSGASLLYSRYARQFL